MRAKVTLVLDRLTLQNSEPSLQTQQDSIWRKTLEYCFQLVLKNEIIFLIIWCWGFYLKEGNGDPCAGQVNAKVCNAFSWYAARLDFEENFGIALPTGSKIITDIFEDLFNDTFLPLWKDEGTHVDDSKWMRIVKLMSVQRLSFSLYDLCFSIEAFIVVYSI